MRKAGMVGYLDSAIPSEPASAAQSTPIQTRKVLASAHDRRFSRLAGSSYVSFSDYAVRCPK